MNDKINLVSRYDDVNTDLCKLDDNQYIVNSSSYIREVYDDKGIVAIDFDGGPFLEVGKTVINSHKIAKIEVKYVITFE